MLLNAILDLNVFTRSNYSDCAKGSEHFQNTHELHLQ